MRPDLSLALALLPPSRPRRLAAEVRSATFTSAALGREVGYVVDVPPSYDVGCDRRKYPVVYALHGLFEGSGFWEGRGLAAILAELRARGSLPEFLVVAVDGGNSFFVNAKGGRYEDLVTQDLVAHVESSYRVVPGRAGRGAARHLDGRLRGAAHRLRRTPGSSRGRDPQRDAARDDPVRRAGARRGQMAAFHQVFGDPDRHGAVDRERPARARREELDAKTAPALFLDCGAEDRYGLASGHRELHRILQERGVAHSLELPPGDHGYEFVRARLEKSLRFLGERLR